MTSPRPAETRPLVTLLLVLTFTTGLIDAISVLGLGRVFTANMTGNVVFLGFALARTPDFSAARSVAALVAFIAGAAVGGRLAVRLDGSRRRWLLVVAGVESAALLAAALVAVRHDGGRLDPAAPVQALIVLTAAAMGIRNATVRRLGVPELTTTVLTMTLTGLGADSALAGGSNPRWRRRVASVLSLLGGAIVGAALVQRVGLAWPLALTGVLTLAATIACVARPTGGPSEDTGVARPQA